VFFERAWWRRLWTIQEATSCSENIFICGNRSITWAALEIMIKVLKGVWGLMCSTAWSPGHDAIRKSQFDRAMDMIPITAAGRLAYQHPAHLRLFSLLRRFRDRDTTDERDKVNGLLSLADQSEDIMIPDYNLTASIAYIRTAKNIVLQEQNLGILGECHYNRDLYLVSWVPLWNCGSNFVGPHVKSDSESARDRLYRADNGRAMNAQFAKWDTVLCIGGVLFDAISEVGEVSPSLHDQGQPIPTVLSIWHKIPCHLNRLKYQLRRRKELSLVRSPPTCI